MNEVMPTYEINLKTIALMPGKSIDYGAKVLTEDGIKYVLEPPFNLIKEACLIYDWTTYEARRHVVIKYTKYSHKTPIPISICNGIYFFPTHSPQNIDNIWLAFHQISTFEKLPKRERTKDARIIVYFKNRAAMKLGISHDAFEKQYYRTLDCMMQIEKQNKI